MKDRIIEGKNFTSDYNRDEKNFSDNEVVSVGVGNLNKKMGEFSDSNNNVDLVAPG